MSRSGKYAQEEAEREKKHPKKNAGVYLVFPVTAQKVLGHVRGQDVLQQNPVEVLHGFDLLALPLELVSPQKVQPTVIFILLQEDTE